MTKERHIKAAIIEGLQLVGALDADSVVISEFPVPNWSRRADLVLANGRLVAFEIKTDADDVARLEGQLSAYSRCMEGVSVVFGPRHATRIEKVAPEGVGLYLAESTGNGIKIQLIRKPRICTLNIKAALSLMRVDDLKRAVKRAGQAPSGTDRYTLESQAAQLPRILLRESAVSSLKQRYRPYFTAYKCALEQGIAPTDAISFLKRPSWNS